MTRILFLLLVVLGLLGFVLGALTISSLLSQERQLKRALSQWGKMTGVNCLTQSSAPICQEILAISASFPDPKRPIPPDFDTPAALFAANICQRLIVFVGAKAPSTLALPDFEKYSLVSLPDDSQSAAIVWTNSKNQCTIAFHGTLSLPELRADLDYTEISVNNYRVHEGFYKQYLRLQASLAAAIPSTTQQIFIAGHSLGAALAFLAASELSMKFSVEVWGSAPPRLGDQTFVDQLTARARCNSLVNLADAIPSLPWSYMPNFSNPSSLNAFSHVTPLNVFNRLEADLLSCHLLPAYYQGIISGKVMRI